MRFASVPGSRTANIVNIETQSNVGQPGRFMFRIDEAEVVAGGCNIAGKERELPLLSAHLIILSGNI